MRILTLTKLYPNAAQPNAALFVERRLREILKLGDAEARVVAPVPWVPEVCKNLQRYRQYALVPRREVRSGIEVIHPRYPLIPKIGMSLHPFGMALGLRGTLAELRASGFDFDVIDAHFFYPDGVAAALLGTWFNRPVVITARGSDISHFATYAIPRRLVRWAAGRSAGIVAVAQALKDAMINLGIDGSRITVLRNGVDLEAFAPVDRREARARVGWSAESRVLLSVGALLELKGHHVTIAAMAKLPEWRLVIAGAGPERERLETLARELGVADRVQLLGERSAAELRYLYSAADISVLASSREGWANVLLESMACGTPVVATAIWGTPEVVRSPEAGVLAGERTPEAIAAAVEHLWAHYPGRARTRAYAAAFSWDSTAAGQKAVYERAIAAGTKQAPLGCTSGGRES